MNHPDRREALHQRLDRLDQEMRAIRKELEGSGQPSSKTPPPPLPSSSSSSSGGQGRAIAERSPTASPTPIGSGPKKWRFQPEVWLGRLGIGLLILGILFLFQYAFQQGWIVPWLRIAFGVVLGGVLIFGSRRVEKGREWFADLLGGGGLAIWFATVCAADRLYGLIPGALALVLVLVLVAIAYRWALLNRSRFLAFFSTLGGLLSPLILMKGGEISGIEVAFTCIISAGAVGIFIKRAGLEQIFLVFMLGGLLLAEAGQGDGEIASTLGSQVAWIFWGGLMMGATWVRHASANSWVPQPCGKVSGLLSPVFVTASERFGQAGATVWGSVPIVWFLSACALWNLEKVEAGWVALAMALISLGFWRGAWSRNQPVPGIREVLLFHACLFGTSAVILIFDGGLQLLTLAAVGWGMIQWGIRHRSAWIRVLGNLILAGTSVWLLVRVVDRLDGSGYRFGMDVAAWIDFLVLVFLLSQALLPWRKWESRIYWLFGVILTLIWSAGMLAGVPDRGPWLTFIWALTGGVSLAAGIRFNRSLFTGTAISILTVVLCKLFLVDLATVGAGWRVLLFLLLGGGFVGLSYGVSRLRGGPVEKTAASSSPPKIPAPGESSGTAAPPTENRNL